MTSRPAILPRALTGPAPIWLSRRCRGWLEDKVQGQRGRLPAAKPLRGFDPSRMRRAVVIGEPGNLVGIELDPPSGLNAPLKRTYHESICRDCLPGSAPMPEIVNNSFCLARVRCFSGGE